ncbi:hypothetical protein B0H17DRAFT_1126438 [Mycena rosella]|uniref:Uncharacterized protein n=1 Tax=Mycena rosella TaxID=1033263 RepID=A0AAD7GT95_MYCRO|nr:hypothetical protein B0H17DRAFT_1126438 [Mycena rosella]
MWRPLTNARFRPTFYVELFQRSQGPGAAIKSWKEISTVFMDFVNPSSSCRRSSVALIRSVKSGLLVGTGGWEEIEKATMARRDEGPHMSDCQMSVCQFGRLEPDSAKGAGIDFLHIWYRWAGEARRRSRTPWMMCAFSEAVQVGRISRARDELTPWGGLNFPFEAIKTY